VNWEAISALAQILGTVAVVVSLVYLGIQVRHNSAALRAANSHHLAHTALTFSTTLGAQSDLANCFNRGLAMSSDLSAAEIAQFAYLFHAWLRIMENGHYQFSQGHLDEELFTGWSETARSLFSTPGGRQLWETAKPRVRRAFQEFIEKEIMPTTTPDAAANFLKPFEPRGDQSSLGRAAHP
jgi:hypothetical protein